MAGVGSAPSGNSISSISAKKEEFCTEENQQTSIRDGLDKLKPSELRRSDKGTALEMLTSLKEAESKKILVLFGLFIVKEMHYINLYYYGEVILYLANHLLRRSPR